LRYSLRGDEAGADEDSGAVALDGVGCRPHAPELRELFPEDLSDQGRKLATTIAVTVDSIGDWDRMAPILGLLARRHLGYGVEPCHYAIVAQALVMTLEAGGVGRTALLVWQRAMSIVTGYMIEVAYPGPAPGRNWSEQPADMPGKAPT
jgi:nitric oxide dioxygenase